MKKLSVIYLCLFLLSHIAFGQIPQTMTYQGIILDDAGEVISDGSYAMVFKLYESEDGAGEIWAEEQTIEVHSGIINVILGQNVPLTVSFTKPYWLGVSMKGKDEFRPRIQLTASAYSLNTRSIPDSVVTSVKIADGAVTGKKLSPEVLLEAGNTLDQAYDHGGPGEGRTIIADAGPLVVGGKDGLRVTGPIYSSSDYRPDRSIYLGSGDIQRLTTTNDFFITYHGGMGFFEGGTQTLSIFPGGNLGIGTKEPKAKLEVAGKPGVDGIMFPDGTLQTSAASGSGNTLDQAYDQGGPGSGRKIIANSGAVEISGNDGMKISSTEDRWPGRNLKFRSYFKQEINATNDLAIVYNGGIGFFEGNKQTASLSQGGNFGIGTPAPKAKLEIAGEPGVDGIMFPDGSLQKSAASGGLGGPGSTGYLAKYTDSDTLGNSIVFEKDDNIGIGTADPSEALDVTGNIIASGNIKTTRFFRATSKGLPERYITLISGTAQSIETTNDLYFKSGGGMSFWQGGTQRLSIDQGDVVNIGTGERSCTLDVYGPIYQRGGELHADYVFEPGYKLESIETHSDFMWQNRHLAAIPKSSVDAEGKELVDIGLHRRGIVEELEKAHIYIDQLLNRIKQLEQRVEKIEANNSRH